MTWRVRRASAHLWPPAMTSVRALNLDSIWIAVTNPRHQPEVPFPVPTRVSPRMRPPAPARASSVSIQCTAAARTQLLRRAPCVWHLAAHPEARPTRLGRCLGASRCAAMGASETHEHVAMSEPPAAGQATGVGGFCGVHHVAVCCASLEVSLDFYARLLGALQCLQQSVERRGCHGACQCAEPAGPLVDASPLPRFAAQPRSPGGQAAVPGRLAVGGYVRRSSPSLFATRCALHQTDSTPSHVGFPHFAVHAKQPTRTHRP